MSDNTIRIILITSVVIVIIIAIIAYLIVYTKIRKYKKILANSKNLNDTAGINLVLERKDIGELFWDLKTKTKNPTNDLYMEFSINTIIRNSFNLGLYLGKTNGYEPLSFVNKTLIEFEVLKKDLNQNEYNDLLKSKPLEKSIKIIDNVLLDKQYDAIIFNDINEDNRDLFGKYYKNLKPKGLIFVYDINKNKKMKKNFINHLKLVNSYYEEIKIDNGIILITKK